MHHWIQTFTIIGSFAAFFIYLMNRMDAKSDKVDKKFDHMEAKLCSKIDHIDAKLCAKIDHIDAKFDAKYDQLRLDMYQGFANLQNYILLGKIESKLNDSKDSKKN